MKQHLGFGGFVAGSTLIALTAQPAFADATLVTNVSIEQNDGGIELVLTTEAGDRPQIFTIDRGNSLTADIINTQLQLPEGNSFRQDNPAPGITAVVVQPLDANSIRVIVQGTNAPPSGEVSQREDDQLVFNFSPASGSNISAQPAPTPSPEVTAQVEEPEVVVPEEAEPTAEVTPVEPPQTPDVVVPNPEITIEGVPIPRPQPQVVPPFLPRAVAPPVGDIAVSTIDAAPDVVDLGTAERVPRLVLREAPAREVLALLARAANLNLAFTATPAGPEGGTAGGTNAGDGPRISLDIENEPVQDVFNYVLRIAGLEANRTGRTIFVGPRLPDTARSTITRTLRLNQVDASEAATFLATQGAESRLFFQERSIETIGEGAAARVVEVLGAPEVVTVEVEQGNSPVLLNGLSVTADSRLNTLTLVGTPRAVEIASALLTQLDLRRRQVAVNVKIIDVNLNNTEDFSTSFSFGIGDTFFSQDQGAGTIIIGDNNPPSAGTVRDNLFSRPVIQIPDTAQPSQPFFDEPPGGAPFDDADRDPDTTPYSRPDFGTGDNPLQPGITDITINEDGTVEIEFEPPTLFQYPSDFLASLEAQIVSGNAKILTDPTLIVQEGQTAAVSLVEQIPVRLTQEIEEDEGGGVEVATNVELQDVGLQLELQVSRIDDNGFITLAVLPRVSSPVDTISFEGLDVTLIARRELSSGQIRLRDGQTLILSGIIQDTDRTTVSKVPILGDIPILGALFRDTSRENTRQEVIVLVTPQILDDSDRSVFGYAYTPGREVQEVLRQQP